MSKRIQISADKLMNQAWMTAEDYARSAAEAAKKFGLDAKQHPEAFATFVGNFMIAAALDYHASAVLMASDDITESLDRVSDK